MAENLLGSDTVTQVAVVVRDIEKVSQAWAKLLGVPVPAWRLTDTRDVAHTQYHGQPSDARAKLAFFRLGQVSLEIIEPVGSPSTWQEFLDRNGPGIHHIAFNIKGMDEVILRLDKLGAPLAQRGDYTGGRYAYIDGVPEFAAVIELLENF